MLKVKRHSDGKIFDNDMRAEESIYEIHFCTSYTQVLVQEVDEYGKLESSEIICPPVGAKPNWVDFVAVQDDETGELFWENVDAN